MKGDKRKINVDIAAQLIHCEAWEHEICPARTVLPPSPHRIGTFMKAQRAQLCGDCVGQKKLRK